MFRVNLEILLLLLLLMVNSNIFSQEIKESSTVFSTRNLWLSQAQMKIDSLIFSSTKGDEWKLEFEYDNSTRIKAWKTLRMSDSNYVLSSVNKMIYEDFTITNLGLTPGLDTAYRKIEYYDSKTGCLGKKLDQIYKDGRWENSYQYTIWPELDGNIVKWLGQFWFENSWQNTVQWMEYYTGRTRLDSTLHQYWAETEWKYTDKVLNYYNTNNKLHDSSVTYEFSDGAWQRSYKKYYEYDISGNKLRDLCQTGSGRLWRTYLKYSYEYQGPEYIKTIYCEFNDGQKWIPWNANMSFSSPDGFTATFSLMNKIRVYYTPVTSTNNEASEKRPDYSLCQNYPNPFNPTTSISYSIPENHNVKLSVCDMLGKEVKILVDEYKSAGSHTVQLNASDLPSGIFIYTIQAGKYRASKKLMILK